MSRVTFTHTVICPEADYPVVVEAKLEAPAPECGDPGGWRMTKWHYQPDWPGIDGDGGGGDRDLFGAAFGYERLALAQQMACDAAILEHDGMKIEGSDAA